MKLQRRLGVVFHFNVSKVRSTPLLQYRPSSQEVINAACGRSEFLDLVLFLNEHDHVADVVLLVLGHHHRWFLAFRKRLNYFLVELLGILSHLQGSLDVGARVVVVQDDLLDHLARSNV